MRRHGQLLESGVPYLIRPLVFYQMFLLWNMQQGGVRLSSNGSSSSGRCGVGDDFGTSDPQEPQEPVNFSATLLISVHSQ